MKYDITVQGHHPLNLISLQCEQRRGQIDGTEHVSLITSKMTQIKTTCLIFNTSWEALEFSFPTQRLKGLKKVPPGFILRLVKV